MEQRRKKPITARPGLTALLALVVLVAPASAQAWRDNRVRSPEPVSLPTASELARVRIDPALLELVRQLDADAYTQRQSAMAQISDSWDDPLPALAILERELLTTEQRHRLLTVVRQKMVRRPRGALGITMLEQAPQRRGGPMEVVVTDLLPGLPAEEVLRRQDRIFKVDGRELFERSEVLRRVQSKKPGETVRLSVRRVIRDADHRVVRDERDQMQYEDLEIDLTLGSADRLVDPQTGELPRTSPVVIQRARNADAAVNRYSRSQPVPVNAESKGVESTPMKVGWSPGDDLEAATPLKRLIDDLQKAPANLVIERDMRDQWEMTRSWLSKQWRRNDLSDDDRRDLLKAIQLVSDLLKKD